MADSSEWAMDTFSEVKENDPLRLLDLENDTQMLLNKVFPNSPTEKERAIHNFNKMVYGDAKPLGDYIVEGAGRIIPSMALIGADSLLRKIGGLLKKGGSSAWEKILKGQKDKYTKKKFKEFVSERVEGLEGKYEKPLIKSLQDKYFKDIEEPVGSAQNYAIRKIYEEKLPKESGSKSGSKALEDESKKALKALAKEEFNVDLKGENKDVLRELAKIYEDPANKVVSERVASYKGSLQDKYLKYLIDRDNLVKATGKEPEELDKMAHRVLSIERRAEVGKEANIGRTLNSDRSKNPDLYKGLDEEAQGALFSKRKEELTSLIRNGKTKFFGEGTEGSFKPISMEDFKELNKNRLILSPNIENVKKQLKRDAKLGLGASAVEGIADASKETALNTFKKQNEPVFKNFTFDKEPDTSFPKTLLHSFADIIGFDLRNPNRYNADDIQWFLEEAQKKGLLTNDNWKNWTARQQVEKVDEIAHSPYAEQFIKYLEEK